MQRAFSSILIIVLATVLIAAGAWYAVEWQKTGHHYPFGIGQDTGGAGQGTDTSSSTGSGAGGLGKPGTIPNNPSSVTKDLKVDYGSVTISSMNKAIADAKKYFGTDPNSVQANATYTIKIPAGTFSMPGTIDVSGVKPGAKGKLVIQGAGMDATTILMDPDAIGILGKGTYHVEFTGMHFTLDEYTMTQGHVVSVEKGKIFLDIQPGFPTPLAITDTHLDQSQACPEEDQAAGGWGRYLKRYTDSATDPHVYDENAPDISWCKAVAVPGHPGRWEMDIKNTSLVAPYPLGSLIAVKSKHIESAYAFCGGSDVEFDSVKWTQSSRGIFKCGFNNVHINNVRVVRPPAINGQVPAIASPGGGPQIGDYDIPSSGHIVENSYIQGAGDDSIAFFNASGIIRNNTILDGWGRINLNRSPGAQLIGNTIMRVLVVVQDKPTHEEK